MKKLSKFLMLLVLAVVIAFVISACKEDVDDLTQASEISPEQKPVAERWSKWLATVNLTATLDISVSAKGVCTITVGGIPQLFESGNWDRYKTRACYDYTTVTDIAYEYEFEAWTQSGSRNVNIEYYDDWPGNTILGVDSFPITATRQIYTIEGVKIPNGGVKQLRFGCADKLGTFYVRILSITECTTP